MLVLSRKVDEAIVISDNITVRVLEINGDRVKLGISAPLGITILRQELCEEVKRANIEAATKRPDPKSVLPNLSSALRRRSSEPGNTPTGGAPTGGGQKR